MAVKKGSKSKIVYFSPEEWDQVCDKAEDLGMRVGTYIRVIAVKGEIIKINMFSLNELRLEISRIGNNINQIVHLANETQTVGRKDIELLTGYLRDIRKLLKDWISSLL